MGKVQAQMDLQQIFIKKNWKRIKDFVTRSLNYAFEEGGISIEQRR